MKFFSNYLVNGKTKYSWNDFSSLFYNIDVGVGQGSALSLILSALYLSPIFHILENCLKNLKIPIPFLSFIDDRLFISQNKSISVSNTNLFYSYNVISSLLTKFGLIMEYNKIKVFHFSKSYRAFNPPPLDLFSLGGLRLLPKTIWKYLDFIFDCKISFQDHIDFYMNKTILTVKCMKMLENSTRSLILLQKWCLYRCYTLLICHIQVHPSGNYIPVVILSANYTSLPSTVATFLTIYLIAVLQLSGYFVFHSRNTPIQLSLLW